MSSKVSSPLPLSSAKEEYRKDSARSCSFFETQERAAKVGL